MPLLKFEVEADYDKVIKLREEITRLNDMLLKLPADAPVATVRNIEAELAKARGEFRSLTDAAAIAGAELEDGFKKKIYDASQTVNDFTERIIGQRAKIREIQGDVRKLAEEYRASVGKNPAKSAYYKSEYESAKKALEEEKAALFALTQEQATARLSVKRLRDEYALLKQEAGDGSEMFEQMKKQLVGMGKDLLKNIGIGVGIKEFIGQMVQVRGEFQEIETSLEVLLGSEEKAAKLMGEVKEFAKVSPLDLKSTAAATQMMLGFNIEAEKVPRYLQAIGDISMGNTQRFNSLTLAFSQMSATGKLMGQDLNQMINAGFNPLQIMADKTGKSIATLKEEMSKGAITSQMVQQAFIDATDAGGKFYQMSEKASKTINGQISMLQDALDAMFNSLGEQSEGVMLGAIETTTSLVENYETVGKVIAGLVAVYGTYKSAMLVSIAVEQARAGSLMTTIKATKAATVATAAFNKVLLANPYALAAAAIVGVVAALWAMEDSTSAAERETERLTNRIKEQTDAINKQKESVSNLISTVRDETETDQKRQEALDELKQTMPEVFAKYQTFIDLVNESSDALTKETNAIYARNEALNGRKNYDSDIQREKELNELIGLIRESRKGRLSTLSQTRMSDLQLKYKIFDGVFESALDKAEDALETTRESLRSQANEMRDKANAAWDVELSKTTTKEQVEAITAKAQKYIDTAKAADKKYVLIDGVPIPVEEFERRVKAGNARAKLITDNANKDFLTEAKKAWDAAKKKVEDVKNKRNDRSLYADESSYKAALLEAQKEEERAKAAYKSLGGDPTGKTAKAVEKEADKRLKAEQKASDELLSLKRQTQQSEIDILKDGTDKKIAQINLDYQKQMDAIAKQERTLREQNKVQKIDGLTDEQQTALDAQRKAAETTRDKQIADTYKADLAYMRDYLKEYGTFQQQKLAIAEEYNQRIAESTNDWEKRSLAKERDAAIAQVDINAIKAEIDWKGLFSGVGTLMQGQIQPTIDKLTKLTQSEEFKQYPLEDQQQVFDFITQLQSKIGGGLRDSFVKLGKAVDDHQKALLEQEKAENRAKEATDNYNRIIKEKTRMGKDGKPVVDMNDAEIKAAQDAMLDAADALSTATKRASGSLDDVQDASQKASEGINNLVSGLQNLGSGSMSGILSGLSDIGKLFKGDSFDMSGIIASGLAKSVGGAVGTALAGPLGGQIIEGVFSLLDLFKDGIENLFSSLIDTILGAVDGLIGSILSLDIPKAIFTSLKDGLENIIESFADFFTLGHVYDINWSGSNAKEVTDTINRLTDRNERLISAISGLTETMKTQGIAQAVSTYNQAYANQQEVNQNLLDIARAQAGYHGSHHSWNSQWGGFSNSQMDYIRTNVRSDFNGDIFTLSPEEMAKLLDNVSIVESILNTGEGGYGSRLLERLEDYAAQAGKLEEITGELKENLTSVTFDSLRDSFHSSLMDMDKDARDFSKDLSRYLMESVLNAKLKESLDKELEEWYDKWAEYSKSDGLDSRELEELQRRYNEIVEKGIAIRDEAAAITGYDSASPYTQEPSKGVYEGLSQDLGMEMNGRMTAIQDGVGRIEQLEAERNEMLRSMSALDGMSIADINSDNLHLLVAQQTEAYAVHDDVRRILAESYVELSAIRENTGAIVKPIKEIRSELGSLREEIRQNL